MSVPYYGDFAEDDTVLIPFNTFDSNDPSASVTITNLADADIKVHKDGSATEIVTDGASVSIDFDSITGNHLITIDTSVDAAYSTGSEYAVRIEGTTVDGATINAWVGCFSIERAGGVLALLKGAGGLSDINTDVEAILDDTGTSGVLLAATADSAALVDSIWDEPLTVPTHNVANSSGRRLRELKENGAEYQGAIWIDTVNGTAGTTDYENGTPGNPVDSIADAYTLAASLGYSRFF